MICCIASMLSSCYCAFAQDVALQGAEAVSVRLGSGLNGRPHAQLDGLKSRTVWSDESEQRNHTYLCNHTYLTEWRALDVASRPSGAALVISDKVPARDDRLSSRLLQHGVGEKGSGSALDTAH